MNKGDLNVNRSQKLRGKLWRRVQMEDSKEKLTHFCVSCGSFFFPHTLKNI